jgi:hypothetical protein
MNGIIIQGLLLISSLSSVAASLPGVEAAPVGQNENPDERGGVCDSGSSSNAEQCVVLQESSSSSTESSSSSSGTVAALCADESENCAQRSKGDGCIKDFANMRQDCQATCLLCSGGGGSSSIANVTTASSSSRIKGKKRSSSSSDNDDNTVLQVKNIYSVKPQSIAASDDGNGAMSQFVHRVNEYMYNQVYQDQNKFSLQ